MIVFATELRVALEASGWWRLLEPFVVRADGETIVVPPGFRTDFDSVPRLPLAYMLLGNTGIRAAVLHDWLYDAHALRSDGSRWPRAEADRLFLAAMRAEGVPAWAARMKWLGVRAGGAGPYEEAKAHDA